MLLGLVRSDGADDGPIVDSLLPLSPHGDRFVADAELGRAVSRLWPPWTQLLWCHGHRFKELLRRTFPRIQGQLLHLVVEFRSAVFEHILRCTLAHNRELRISALAGLLIGLIVPLHTSFDLNLSEMNSSFFKNR